MRALFARTFVVVVGLHFALNMTAPPAHAVSIAINFSTDALGANHNLAPADVTGVVPQQNWNNASNDLPSLSNLLDDQGHPSGASVTWTHGPLSTNVAPGTPTGDLLHTAIGCSPNPDDGIVVTNIPYSQFDLYLYMAAGNAGLPTAIFKINKANSAAEQLSVKGLPDRSGNANFVLATLDTPGNYLYLGGVTGSTLYVAGSGFAAVDGLQIVETPEPASIILLAGALLCAALRVPVRGLRTRFGSARFSG